jgi:solute:Na+ symporter, SSS family
VAWTDFLQFVVMMLGGLIVTVIGLDRVGGLGSLMNFAPDKFKIIYPITDPNYPWFGVWTLFISIGIWYNCTNQFIVQRCLGARSEWDARMGVVFAGFMKILLPLLVVVPGIVAFKLFPGLSDKDQAFPRLVRELVPTGLSGIVMAGLASGMMSHISSVLNSCSTVFTMDLYRPFWTKSRLATRAARASNSTDYPRGSAPPADARLPAPDRTLSDAHLVRVGRISGVVILLIATLLAMWFTRRTLGVFDVIQNVGAWVAAPIAAIFLLGVLWRRATAAAATFVLLFAFPYTVLVEYVLFKRVSWLMPFDNWLNRTFLVWATSMVLTVVISLLTAAPDPEKIKGIIWTWKVAALPESERHRNRGLRNLLLWWLIFIGIMASLYAYVIWFQYAGPGKH